MTDLKDVLSIIRSEFSKLKIPTPQNDVYKDECIYSFDSPFSDDGLFVNLINFHGVGKDFLQYEIDSTKSKLFLHQKWFQIQKNVDSVVDPPTKLAIGVTGGFIGGSQYDLIKDHSLLVVTPTGNTSFALPNPELPEFVGNICQAIIDHNGMKSKMEV
jgi:ubiquitin carboxyl-terminal hydrolase 5/13